MNFKTVKMLSILMSVMVISGCQTITYKDNEVEFSKTNYFTFTEISGLTVTIGDKSMTIEAVTSDEIKALEKVAEGVAKGLASAVK